MWDSGQVIWCSPGGRYTGTYPWEAGLPPVPEDVWGRQPYQARWFVIPDYEHAPENQNPHKPWHVAALGQDDFRSMHAWLLGRRPGVLKQSWHVYKCRVCGRLWAAKRSPNIMRRPDCGCVQRQQGANTQTSRLEGKRFGRLTVIAYHLRQCEVAGGWECLCSCGRVEPRIPTIELLQLRKLACRRCCPEEYTQLPGRKAKHSLHGKLLAEHRQRRGKAA